MSNPSTRLSAAALFLAALVAHPSGQQPPDAATAPPAGQARAGAEQPAVTFKVEINYVEVDAAVFDKDGRFVSTLGKDDFEVLEDGKPQEISSFSLVNIPIERADRPLYARHPITPDVADNGRPFDGRVFVIVLDDLHTQPFHTAGVRAAAKQFVDRYMGDNDLAAVIHASGKGDASQEFTSNKRLLDASIDRFMGQSLKSLTLARLDQYQRQSGIPGGFDSSKRIVDPFDAERGYRARQSLDTLRSISDWVGSIRGRRKAIIYVSEGIDYDVYDFNNREASTVQDSMRSVIASATRANVSVYAIDPRGLTQLGDTTIEASGGFPEDPQYNLSLQSFQDELRLQQQSLRSLAEDTGGYASVNSNDFSDAWQRVVVDNSNYYVLGYYPTNDRRDGRYRKIDVRVKQPGLRVRSRKGYTAPHGKPPGTTRTPAEDKTSPELRQALDSPLPLPGLTLRAFAAPFKGAAPNASVAIGVEAAGDDLTFTEKNGKFTNDLELSAIAIDASGKVRDGDRSLLDMGLKPETRQRVLQSGLRMQTRLKLPPGRYQIRVAARESGSGHIGSVNYDVEVPDFTKPPLAMSGIVLTAASTQNMMTAKADEELKNLLPAPATAQREFPVGDTVALFVEVYDNQVQKPHKVTITTSVIADDGHTVSTTTADRESTELNGKPGGYGHTQEIPLKVSPGLYVLRVEAKSTLGQDPPISREVPFRVVAGRQGSF